MHSAKVWRALAILVSALWLAPALPVQAESARPQQGLMWNRTGLPAVFPLQVKSRVGQDYLLLLSNPETDADVLAAYIVGGRFFRVLVPPGRFRVRFASGVRWEGEDTMFGRHGETEIIEMPEPLTFEVKGLGTKVGHLIDLTDVAAGETAQVSVTPVKICQVVDVIPQTWSEEYKKWVVLRDKTGEVPMPALPANRGRFLNVRSRYCWDPE